MEATNMKTEICELCGREAMTLTDLTEEGATWMVCQYCYSSHSKEQ
jgi:ribosome-binding protein aMBF1 (putative translation factor)